MGHLRDFLVESNSALAEDVFSRSVEDTLVAMEVANRTDVGVDIRNIGALMFSDRPEKTLPGAKIELVWFHSPEEEGSDDFTEKVFTGPLFRQVKDALHYVQTNVIEEKVVKISGKAEAERYFNYPYDALEEALANAVQHKSYQIPEAVEIRIYLNRIMILNYPGPALWIDMDEFREGKAVSRRYRNRRIGEFFKEIDLSEKKSTGIRKILRALERNGSPAPEFKTDAERNYLITTIPIRAGFDYEKSLDIDGGEQAGAQVREQVGTQDSEQVGVYGIALIRRLEDGEMSRGELLNAIGLSNAYKNYARYIKPLIEQGYVEMTIPDKPTSKSQKYRLTGKGRA
jgi:ATP-dependent DNA helicase RecG